MEYLTTPLEDAWRDLWRVFGTRESWTADEAKCKDIQQRLSHFNSLHSSDPDSINNLIGGLSRGFYLMKSALEWQEPAAGHNSTEKPNDTHKARGIQWRLVMAYSGFETVTNTLLINEKYLTPNTIKDFTEKCSLPDYCLLNSPAATRGNLEKWLNKPSLEKKSALADFLSLENGDKTIIEEWIVKSTPVSTWVDAVRLTKAIRNATAHGALSPTKVNQWGLQKPLLTLSDNLGEIVVASMLKLVNQQSYVN